jgi:hypothetical protein
MQGKIKNIERSMDIIPGFDGKLKLCLQHIASGSTERFPTVCLLTAGNTLICGIEEHLIALQQKFLEYLKQEYGRLQLSL